MLVLALLTFWLERTVREEESHPSLRRHDPDYIISGLTATTYNRQGSADSVLSAAKMMHYPDDDTTELAAPRVLQSRPTEPRFTVRADRGAVTREGEEIFLYDNVQLEREAEADRPAARLTTSFLHVVRDRSLMVTDRPVLIVEGLRSLSGVGMEYNNETRELVLRSDVQARFDSAPPTGR